MEARLLRVIDDTYRGVVAVRVGSVPLSGRAPERYVVLGDGEIPVLLVEIYADVPDAFPFEDVLVWRDYVVVGLGSYVHVVHIASRSAFSVPLGSYFGHLYPTPSYLLIASGERLLRMEPSGAIAWVSERLGVDGVVVSDPGPPLIRGEAERDPPGGWVSFALSAAEGKLVVP